MGEIVPIEPGLAAARAREAARQEELKAICVSLGIDPSILDLTFLVRKDESGRTVSFELLETEEEGARA